MVLGIHIVLLGIIGTPVVLLEIIGHTIVLLLLIPLCFGLRQNTAGCQPRIDSFGIIQQLELI